MQFEEYIRQQFNSLCGQLPELTQVVERLDSHSYQTPEQTRSSVSFSQEQLSFYTVVFPKFSFILWSLLCNSRMLLKQFARKKFWMRRTTVIGNGTSVISKITI